MRDRPILFSGAMVRAIRAGTKTQTRRALKLQPSEALAWSPAMSCFRPMHAAPPSQAWRCPYGQPGDRLWVRESWAPDPPDIDGWGYTAWAGCREGKIAGVPERFRHPRFCVYAADWLHGPIRWTPSIHMPRWASRITLEVKGVRVERLQDISEADAYDEGTAEWAAETVRDGNKWPNIVRAYRGLWESINGPDSWAANPWVWVVEFQPIESGAQQ